tara:strand:- start:3433 stop:4482 length:1050 start_codon:yes stop_codon:yes gene_type:complete
MLEFVSDVWALFWGLDFRLRLLAGGLLLISITWLIARRGSQDTAGYVEIQRRDEAIRREQYAEAEKALASATKTLEEYRDRPLVIQLIHDTDIDSPFRDAAPRNISFDEAFELIRRIRRAGKNQPVYLILHTLGGYSLPSIMIADALKHHSGPAIAFVPYIAMSGGTVIALACDEIWMHDTARLGPVDTLFAGISIHAIESMNAEKQTKDMDDRTILLRIEAAKYRKYYEDELSRIVRQSGIDTRAKDGTLSHSHAFNRSDAERLGFNVTTREADLKQFKERAKLATNIVDAKLSMIRSDWQKPEPVMPAPVDTADPAAPGETQILAGLRMGTRIGGTLESAPNPTAAS